MLIADSAVIFFKYFVMSAKLILFYDTAKDLTEYLHSH